MRGDFASLTPRLARLKAASPRQSIPSLISMIEAILRKRGSARHLRRVTSIVTAGADLARSSARVAPELEPLVLQTLRVGVSSAEKDASIGGTSGRTAHARAKATRCRCPLENRCGKPRSRCRAMHPARRRAQSSHWPGRRQGSSRASPNTSAIVQSKRGGACRIMLGSLAGKDFRERLPIEEIYAERRERAGAEQDRRVDGVGPSDPGRDDWRQNEKGAIVHRFR